MSYLTELYGVQKLVRALADAAHLTVKYEIGVEQPRTDGKSIYVPQPDATWPHDKYIKWLFSVYHEIGHNVPEMRDCFEVPNTIGIHMQSFIGVCLNILEDYRQEYYKFDEYLGKKKVMSEGRKLFEENILADMRKGKIAEKTKYVRALHALHCWDVHERESWQPDLIGYSDNLYDTLDSEQKGWVDSLKVGPYSKLLNGIRTAWDTYNLTKKILDEVFKIDSEEEEKKAKVMAKTSGSGKKGKGEGDSSERTEEYEVKYDDILPHKHDSHSPTYSPMTIDYEESRRIRDPYSPWNFTDFKVRDWTDVKSTSKTYKYRSETEINTNTTGFSNKLKRLLMIRSKDKYEYGKKKGAIHNSNLYRASIKDAGTYAQKIFKTKKESSILDTAVSVLVDMSGSMGGDKIVNAATSAILLNDSIAKLGVAVEIAGFTERSNGPVHNIMKAFDSRCEGEHLKARFLEAIHSGMEENADGDSVLYSYFRLKQRKEKRKILIVLSDGQPAAHRGYGIHEYTKQVTSQIQKEGIVELYGIGINSDAVKAFYKDYIIINNPSMLEETLLEVLKKKLLNL